MNNQEKVESQQKQNNDKTFEFVLPLSGFCQTRPVKKALNQYS